MQRRPEEQKESPENHQEQQPGTQGLEKREVEEQVLEEKEPEGLMMSLRLHSQHSPKV